MVRMVCSFKASPFGRGGAVHRDGEGYCRDRRPRLCGISSFFSRRKKKQKSRWDTCDCVPAKAPGRNYKLLPALAIDSPPGCQCGYAAASRPATLFGMIENKRLFLHCRDRRPRLSDCSVKQKQVIYLNRINSFELNKRPLIVGRVACSRRNSVRTAEDVCPYS